MRTRITISLVLILLTVSISYIVLAHAEGNTPGTVMLPAPNLTGTVSVEQAILQRRSVRTYDAAPLTLAQVTQLLWAAQGVTEPKRGLRTAPSAMASYPLKVYLFAGNVTGLPAGVYHYVPQGHKLELIVTGDQRSIASRQQQTKNAPALLVYTADYTVIAKRMGEKNAMIAAALEAGHSAQNVLLEEVSLGLAGVGMTGFDASTIRETLRLPENEEIIYLVTAGKKG